MTKRAFLIATLFALLLGPACNKQSSDRAAKTPTPAAMTSPTSAAMTTPPTKRPRPQACGKDAECTLTHKRMGNCCLGCAFDRGVHVNRARAIDAWHAKNCTQGGYACPKVDCKDPPGKAVARCKGGRCAAVWGPAKPAGGGKVGKVGKSGQYSSAEKLPPRRPCKKKSDCAMTRARPGQCCPTKCPSGRVGGTVAWVKAVERLRAKHCTAWLKTNGSRCSRPKCYPKGRPETRCQKGRCIVHYARIR